MSRPEHLVNKIDHDGDGYADVSREETSDRPILWPEDGEAVNQRQDRKEDHCKPCTPGLHKGVAIRQIGVWDVLSGHRFTEAYVGDAAANPRDEG